MGARIYKFNIISLLNQQCQRSNASIRPVSTWHIGDDQNLQTCHISVHKGEVFIICCNIVDNKTIIEIKRPKLISIVSSVEYRFELTQIVKIVEGSIIPGLDNLTIALIYYESESNKFKIKRIDMSLHRINIAASPVDT